MTIKHPLSEFKNNRLLVSPSVLACNFANLADELLFALRIFRSWFLDQLTIWTNYLEFEIYPARLVIFITYTEGFAIAGKIL